MGGSVHRQPVMINAKVKTTTRQTERRRNCSSSAFRSADSLRDEWTSPPPACRPGGRTRLSGHAMAARDHRARAATSKPSAPTRLPGAAAPHTSTVDFLMASTKRTIAAGRTGEQ